MTFLSDHFLTFLLYHLYMREFLECARGICPEFHQEIHTILQEYKLKLSSNETRGLWGGDYRNEWQEIVDATIN